jgi:hypothetical protein
VRTLNLTIRPQSTSTLNQTICAGQSYAGHSTSGTFTDTYTYTNGCDSVRTLNLTVRPSNTTNTSQTICFGDTYQGHSTSGVYTTALTDQFGCDSSIILTLTVRPANTTTVNHSICDGETYLGYTTAGTYTDTYVGSNGCDSVRTLNLTVGGGIVMNETFNICSNDTVIIAGTQVTNSGIYIDTVASTTGGCDTLFMYDITVLTAPATPVIVFDSLSGVIHVTGNFTLMQWYKDGVELQNEIFDFITISGPGVYTLVVESFSNTCTATSNPIVVGNGTGISQLNADALKIYPIPTSGLLNLEYTGIMNGAQASVKDLTGKEVMQFVITDGSQQVDISALAPGMYLLHVTGNDLSGIYKIIKQ